jgi:hypothetical protein
MSITKEPSSTSNILGCGVSSHSQSILIVDCEGEDTAKSAYKDQQNTDAFSISLFSHYTTRYLKSHLVFLRYMPLSATIWFNINYSFFIILYRGRNTSYIVGLAVLPAVVMKNSIFWNMTPYILLYPTT